MIPRDKRSKTAGTWYFDFTIAGQRYREAVREARTQAQAERAEIAAKEEVYRGRYGLRKSPEFAVFVRRVYLPHAEQNKRSYRQSDAVYAPVLIRFFGDRRLAEITPMLIEQFKRQRREGVTVRGTIRAPASVNRELECLSRIFSFAIDNGLLSANPCRKVKKLRQDNRRTRYLSREEESRLLDATEFGPWYLRPLIIMAIQTGMRRGELLNLAWSDVDQSRALVYVRDTKSGKDREIPLSTTALEVLRTIRIIGEKVFPLVDFKKAWAGAMTRAEISGLRFHDLRHTAATRWADAGADAFTIAALLGHSTIQMAARYTHAIDERKRRVVEVA